MHTFIRLRRIRLSTRLCGVQAKHCSVSFLLPSNIEQNQVPKKRSRHVWSFVSGILHGFATQGFLFVKKRCRTKSKWKGGTRCKYTAAICVQGYCRMMTLHIISWSTGGCGKISKEPSSWRRERVLNYCSNYRWVPLHPNLNYIYIQIPGNWKSCRNYLSISSMLFCMLFLNFIWKNFTWSSMLRALDGYLTGLENFSCLLVRIRRDPPVPTWEMGPYGHSPGWMPSVARPTRMMLSCARKKSGNDAPERRKREHSESSQTRIINIHKGVTAATRPHSQFLHTFSSIRGGTEHFILLASLSHLMETEHSEIVFSEFFSEMQCTLSETLTIASSVGQKRTCTWNRPIVYLAHIRGCSVRE